MMRLEEAIRRALNDDADRAPSPPARYPAVSQLDSVEPSRRSVIAARAAVEALAIGGVVVFATRSGASALLLLTTPPP